MSQEQRKEEILKEMEALETPLTTIQDRLTNIGGFKKYALEQTFGIGNSSKRTVKDLVDFYRTLIQSFNLELDGEMKALQEACRSMDRESCMVRKEMEEREDFHQKLEKLFSKENASFISILKDARFHFEGKTRLFDEIIVTAGGVIFVDLKNPSCHISIDSDGNYIEFDYRDARIESYSILEMQTRGRTILNGVLKEKGYEEVPIFPIVVFKGKIDYANLCDEVTTMNMSQLEKYIVDLSNEQTLDEEQQRNILTSLKETSNQSDPIEYQFTTDFIEAYADIRSKIEARFGN